MRTPDAFIFHAAGVSMSAVFVKGRQSSRVRALRDGVVNAGATYLDQDVGVD